MLFTIREEPQVTQAVQSAVKIYPRVWEAFEALCWFIARRHRAEVSIATTGGLYYLHKQARGGWAVPEMTVIYTVSEQVIVIHAIKIG